MQVVKACLYKLFIGSAAWTHAVEGGMNVAWETGQGSEPHHTQQYPFTIKELYCHPEQFKNVDYQEHQTLNVGKQGNFLLSQRCAQQSPKDVKSRNENLSCALFQEPDSAET